MTLLVLLALVGCGRDTHTVARFADLRITDSEFAARYKEYLATGSQRDNILLREQILNNMINEKLIYRDLSLRGLDRDQPYRSKIEDVSEKAMLIAYARRVVTDTSEIPIEDLYKEFRAYNSKVTAQYLYAKTEEGARELKSRLDHGETIEALAKEVFEDPGLASNGGSLGTFGWGDMEPGLEGAAFFTPVGTVSDPVRLSMGYGIVKVDNRVENRLVTQADFLKVREKLWRRVLERRIDEIMQHELQSVEKELAPSFNQTTVAEVLGVWKRLPDDKSPSPPTELVASGVPDLTSHELVRFRNGTWSVGEFVKRLENTTERQRSRVRTADDVKSVAIGLAARDALVQKARQEGLESDSIVMAAVRHGKEAFLLKRWLSLVTDTVGASGWDEQAVRQKYEETKADRVYPPEVNVAEILVRTREEAVKLAAQLRHGADFAVLARKHSIRAWAAKRNGELGFGTEAKFGPMGKKFFAARVGDVIGPDPVDPYFGLFKILERREGKPMSFEEARDQITGELKQARQMDLRKTALEDLRQGISISIDNNLLANIEVH